MRAGSTSATNFDDEYKGHAQSNNEQQNKSSPFSYFNNTKAAHAQK
jgi:hypothetical protein